MQEEGVQGGEIKLVKSTYTETPSDNLDPLRREKFQRKVRNVALIERQVEK